MAERNKKPSFFGKLFGGRGEVDDYFEDDDERYDGDDYRAEEETEEYEEEEEEELRDRNEEEREMSINLIDKGDSLEICAPVPGAGPDEINVSITREVITITLSVKEKDLVKEGSYLSQEVYIGRASRSIMLPVDIDVEESSAEVKDGLLLITMPKVSKKKKKRTLVVSRKK